MIAYSKTRAITSVKRSILTKRIGYREFMVLIICTKIEIDLTNRY